MYPTFAYTREMHLIFSIQTIFTNICITYLISNLILMLANEPATLKQKLIFAFWIGAVFHTIFIYIVYLIGRLVLFHPIVYAMVVSPNPVFGYLYYIIGVRVLKLSPVRSIKLMIYFFIYFTFIININRVIAALLPIEMAPKYNFLQNSQRQFIYFVVVIFICFLTKYIIKKVKLIIRVMDKIFIDIRKERITYVAKMIFLYSITVLLPTLINNELLGSIIVILMLALFFSFNVIFDLFEKSKIDLENREVHINVLSGAIDEFNGLKHDFYNILQTYNGYMEIGDMDNLKKYHSSLINVTTHAGNSIELSQKMKQNPIFISLLVSKIKYAENMGVEMRTSLRCSPDNLYIDDLDICRCLACLLDNAIEAAASSKQKKVFFTLESKARKSKLIIITNDTAEPIDIATIMNSGFTSKQNHHGLGLSNVRRIIQKHGNCAFYMTYYNYELSAYIELRQI